MGGKKSGMMQEQQRHGPKEEHDYKMIYCDTFKGDSFNSRRTRNIREECEMEISANKKRKLAKRANLKEKRLQSLTPCKGILEEAACKRVTLDGRTVYFSGNEKREVPLVKAIPKKNLILSATVDLLPIDVKDGLHIRGVCTLIPRSKVKEYLCQNGASLEQNSKVIFDAMEVMEGLKAAHNRRGAKTAPVMETASKYVTMGAAANRTKKGLTVNLRGLQENKTAHTGLSRLWKMVEHVSKQYIGYDDLRALGFIKQRSLFPTFPLLTSEKVASSSTIWPSIALGKNVFLPVHKDRDYFLSVITPVSQDGAGSDEILNYFCFPESGVSVPLRCLDLLIINPVVSHCVSSRRNSQKDNFNASFYLKTAVVGGNDNSSIQI